MFACLFVVVCYLCLILLAALHIIHYCVFFFFSKQKTAYEMRISDWSSDVCSSDLILDGPAPARSLRDRTLVTRRSCRERRRRADRAPEGDHRGPRGPGSRPLPAAPAPRGRSGAPDHRGRRRPLARRRSPTPPGHGPKSEERRGWRGGGQSCMYRGGVL